MKQLATNQRILVIVTIITAVLGGLYTSYKFGYDAGYNIGKIESLQANEQQCEKKLKRCHEKLKRETKDGQ